MLNPYEIPTGSRLYVGASAKAKRELETQFATYLDDSGFEEIVTPIFSYHQTLENPRDIVTFGDVDNNRVSLRADSAQDVVRLVTKRLGRSTEHTKWFYIQPVLKYPTREYYQVGAEWINHSNLSDMARHVSAMLHSIQTPHALQVGHIQIPRLLAKELNLELSVFEMHDLEKLFSLEIPWLSRLIQVTKADEIPEVAEELSEPLKAALMELYECANQLEGDVVVTPLYYAQMEYYDALFFRALSGNHQLAMGGSYQVDGERAVGFGIYLDELLSK